MTLGKQDSCKQLTQENTKTGGKISDEAEETEKFKIKQDIQHCNTNTQPSITTISALLNVHGKPAKDVCVSFLKGC